MSSTPTPPLTPEAIDHLARKRAGAKIGWYFHALVFVLINLGVFAMSEYAFGHRHWSIKPVLGWGFGLVLHGVSVFWLGKGSDFRERMVAKERARLQAMQVQVTAPPPPPPAVP
jgi:2TM domain